MTDWLGSHSRKHPNFETLSLFAEAGGLSYEVCSLPSIPERPEQFYPWAEPAICSHIPSAFSEVHLWLYFTQLFFKGLLELCFVTR